MTSFRSHRLLARLLAVANRPGTDSEGRAARAAAERLAARAGLKVYDRDGVLVAAEAWRVDVMEELDAIAEHRRPRQQAQVESETEG